MDVTPALAGLIAAGILLASVAGRAGGQTGTPPADDPPRYRNVKLSFRERAEDLVARMTLEEKVSQMRDDAGAIERLGVPKYVWWSECLHGVARAGYATVFPQAIGLAATWDPGLIHEVADVIATEARAKHHEAVRQGRRQRYRGLTMWSPNINIFRDPRWGRGQETYGEDPWLTSRLGVAFVRGLQGDDPRYFKVIATPKHFAVHSGPEPDRHHFNAITDEQTLHEIYLPAFKACVVEGRAFSVMGAYNGYRGQACCAHHELLEEILRRRWGFQGYVVSDCGAIRDIYKHHKIVKTPEEAAALAVRSGCDLNCGKAYAALCNAVDRGLITEREIDVSVRRLMEARFRLGLFDPPERVAYARIPIEKNCAPEHRALALRAARESIVLLKNEDRMLPLPGDIGSIAVIGPNADSVTVLEGNYHGEARNPITALEGIRRKVSAKTTVLHVPGSELVEGIELGEIIPVSSLRTGGRPGLKREFFANRELKGEPADTRVDRTVDLEGGSGHPLPDGRKTDFSIRWTGEVVPPKSGDYRFGVRGDDGFRLFLAGRCIIDAWETGDARTVSSERIRLTEGKPCPIRLDYFQKSGDAVVKLAWRVPAARRPIDAAVEAARSAEVAVVVAGLSPAVEGEEMKVRYPGFLHGDRTRIDLPAVQEDLLRAVHATGTPVVLVLMNGSALAVNWAQEHVPAILEAWYPGEEGGTAIADVLFGDTNPAGRLPVTFYRSVDDLPPFEDYGMEGRTYRYFRGDPLYPFGHGLSFTRFVYRGMRLDPERPGPDDTIRVMVTITNAGRRDGDEVIQLYVRDLAPSRRRPLRRLRGFERVHLRAGETRAVTLPVAVASLARYDVRRKRFAVEPGPFEIQVGASSRDIRLIRRIMVKR